MLEMLIPNDIQERKIIQGTGVIRHAFAPVLKMWISLFGDISFLFPKLWGAFAVEVELERCWETLMAYELCPKWHSGTEK